MTDNNQTTERKVTYQAPSMGFWTIPSEGGVWQLASTLLPSMTQKQAAKYSTDEGFHTESFPSYFNLFADIFAARSDKEAEKARLFISQSMRDSYPNTLTRVIYNPTGDDTIVHGYGTDSSVEKQLDFIGESGKLVEVLPEKASLALTGKTPEEVEDLMQYINGSPAYVWRLNEKPSSIDERVAGFSADSGGADLVCGWYPQGSNPSLGVKISARSATKNNSSENNRCKAYI
jgi:hypothetical protein